MIKFWTFQSKHTMEELCKTGRYYPDFDKTCQYESRRSSYDYILDIYNVNSYTDFNNNIFRGKRFKGLVFGITEYDGNPINNYIEYSNDILNFEIPGVSSCCDDIYVLELELPDDTPLLSVDFYKFADLIYYYNNKDIKRINTIDLDLDLIKECLFDFELNEKNDKHKLLQSHIAYIDKRYIKNIYPGVDFKVRGHKRIKTTAICNKLEYYKKRLLLTNL